MLKILLFTLVTTNLAFALPSIERTTLSGDKTDFSDNKGKVLLIVNTASNCGYTSQLAGLQKLHETYKEKGFSVLGFPSNDFGGQEPGSNSEIASYCEGTYGVNFPLYSKDSVTGEKAQKVYKHLYSLSPEEVKWNFEKLILDKDGSIAARFKSSVAPESKQITDMLEELLSG